MKIVSDNLEGKQLAAEVVAKGGVIGFRTDTFYGLGADPMNPIAVRRIFELKGREEGKPILVVISDADIATKFVATRSKAFEALATRLWPGPLTLVASARPELPTELTAGTATIGVRLPNDEDVRLLIRECGGALTATSANVSGQPGSRTALEVARAFQTGIDLIVDGGSARTDRPSTVVDVMTDEARIIREGELSRDEIAMALNEVTSPPSRS